MKRSLSLSSDLGAWPARVTEAACTFEARWTQRALRRVDADLYERLDQQRALYDQACVTGTVAEIALHGAAMIRGYAAVVRAMEAAEEPDDAYMLGVNYQTGLRVAVGHHRASAGHLGADVVWVTPDEVAALMSSTERARMLAAVKTTFPGAELVEGCET